MSGTAEVRLRLLEANEAGLAGEIHRLAGALIPGYDTTLHTPEEFAELYRQDVFPAGPLWGAFVDTKLVGHIALLPGWIDHLYVLPEWHGLGIGSALVKLAQREQSELRLYTFQSNIRARSLYERYGFVLEELTDGSRNEEKMPDCTYHWQRSASY